jgi:hypothetical protein
MLAFKVAGQICLHSCCRHVCSVMMWLDAVACLTLNPCAACRFLLCCCLSCQAPAELVLRAASPFNYCVIDEVDSILIDEARTPLIISGTSDKPSDKYYKVI